MKTKYATGLFYRFKNRLRKKTGLSLNSSYFQAFLWLVNFLLVDKHGVKNLYELPSP